MAKNNIEVKILGDAKGLSRAIDGANSKLGLLGKGAGIAAAGVAALGVGGAAALVKMGSDLDSAYDKIITGTGASGDALEGLKDDFAAIAKRAPAGFDQIADSVASINTNLGLSGQDLQDFSVQVLEASRMLGEDATANADALGRAFNQWQVPAEQMTATTDSLFAATQEYGIGLGTLTDQLNTYGPVLNNAGFSMDEASNLFGQLAQGGIEVSRVMPGLNKAFRTWAGEGKNSREELGNVVDAIKNTTDEQEALTLATEAFGAEGAQRMTTAIRSGVVSLEDLEGALGDTEDRIADTSAETQSWQEKLKILKNKAIIALEPVATKAFDMIGRAIDAVTPYLEQFGAWLGEKLPPLIAAVSQWFQANWPTIQQVIAGVVDWLVSVAWPMLVTVFNGIVAVAQTLVDWFQAAWPTIQEVIQGLVDFAVDVLWPALQEVIGFIQTLFADMVVWVEENWTDIQETIDAVLSHVQAVIETFVDIVMTLWNVFGETIMEYVDIVWSYIQDAIQAALDIIQGIIKTVMALIRGDWSAAWDGIQDIISGAWDYIKNIVQTAVDIVKTTLSAAWDAIASVAGSAWDGIYNTVKGWIDDLVDFIGGIPGKIADFAGDFLEKATTLGSSIINGVISGLGDVASAILSPFKSAWNALARWWNSGPGGFSISVPSFVPGIGGKGWDMPDMPTFHSGGPVGNLNGPAKEVPAILQTGEYVLSRKMVKDMKTGSKAGPTVNIENAYFNDGQDAEMLAQTINFKLG